jgi:xanthine dehydrogenase iron-sulfur cluster and FAD-binding subunit A
MNGFLVPLTKHESLRLSFTINGEAREILVDSYKTLMEVLREDLGLTGTKHGCELRGMRRLQRDTRRRR